MNETDRTAASLTEEGRYRLLVEAITDYAVYMLDPNGLISSWNPGAERFKQYKASEIIGQHFSRFYTDEDRSVGLPARALEIAASEGKFEAEGWRVRKDGSRFWAYVIIDPIRGPGGQLIGFAKITRDLTERRESQKKLEMAREALFQSQKQEAIGRLTGGVAHDFNNLLMAITSSLELMRKRLPADERLSALLDNALSAAKRGEALTRRMLAFARRQDLDIRAIDVPDLVRGMADLLQRALGPTIQLETRFPLHLRPVMADANQLEMALLNLAVNARDAMSGTGSIIIAAREAEVEPDKPVNGLKPGRYVFLSVTDTGAGMDEATLEKATEPFFTTKGVGKGTGLGLSMVDGLADQSGGMFRLKSRLNEGTTAEIWFPAGEKQSAAALARATPEPDQREPGNLRIIAVDDDFLILTNTVAMLEDMGHTAFAASSARQALQFLREEPEIDLVITDQAMPEMTGTQLADVMRTEWPRVPVVLTTGYAEIDEGTAKALPRLSKPFTEQQLAREIARMSCLAPNA